MSLVKAASRMAALTVGYIGGLWMVVYSQRNPPLRDRPGLQESVDGGGAEDSAMSTSTQWKDDEGFRDEVRGPRKQRSRSGRIRAQPRSADDLSDADAPPREHAQPHANGFAKLNGRPEPKGSHQDRDGRGAGGLENGGDRAPSRREARPAPAQGGDRRQGDRPGAANARAPVKVVTVPAPQDKPSRPQPSQQTAAAEVTVQGRPGPSAAALPGRPVPGAEPPSQNAPAAAARAAESASGPPGPLPHPTAVPVPAHQRGERQSAQRPASAEPVPSATQPRAAQGQPTSAPSHRPQLQQQPPQTPAVSVNAGVQVLKRLPRPIPLDQIEGPAPASVAPPMQVKPVFLPVSIWHIRPCMSCWPSQAMLAH